MTQGEQFAATVGVFDGVHRGHRHLISQLCDTAGRHGLRSMVVTLTPHPRLVLTGFPTPLLTTTTERIRLLQETGVDTIHTLTFTPATASLTAREFIREVLGKELCVKLLLIGYDHHFGADGRQASVADYQRWAEEAGIEAIVATRLDSAETVSSSAIRAALSEGDVRKAADMLGRRYMVGGRVVTGARIGRELGFPTANIETDTDNKLLPTDGVYAVVAETESGELFRAMTNIGTRPTVDNSHVRTIETHLLGFSGDLYGQMLRLHFAQKIRETRHFASRDELAAQLAEDAGVTLNFDFAPSFARVSD